MISLSKEIHDHSRWEARNTHYVIREPARSKIIEYEKMSKFSLFLFILSNFNNFYSRYETVNNIGHVGTAKYGMSRRSTAEQFFV